MRNLTQDNITQAVIARLANTPDARLREIMTSLVQHLHAFARDVKLTEPERALGIRFLAAAGRRGSAAGEELGLLSDTLGLSLLTVAMNGDTPPACTELPAGDASLVRGRVLDATGAPVANARISAAQAGSLRSGPDGRFQFRPEPDRGSTAGPVEDLLRATAASGWRPQHLRFTVDADGYAPLAGDVFRSGDDASVEYEFVLTPTGKDGQ